MIEITLEKFYKWKDQTSQFKLRKIVPRPYLNEMVEVNFRRGQRTLRYKTGFKDPEKELNFLNAKAQKQG